MRSDCTMCHGTDYDLVKQPAARPFRDPRNSIAGGGNRLPRCELIGSPQTSTPQERQRSLDVWGNIRPQSRHAVQTTPAMMTGDTGVLAIHLLIGLDLNLDARLFAAPSRTYPGLESLCVPREPDSTGTSAKTDV